MKLFTIGFTKKSAQEFFELLKSNQIELLVDIRLHPEGQLAGFSKKGDLKYFLKELINCDYIHFEYLAPTKEILNVYRQDKNWDKYQHSFLELLRNRGIPQILDRRMFEEKKCCLLCSEPTSTRCHRRLVAELLAKSWDDVVVVHL